MQFREPVLLQLKMDKLGGNPEQVTLGRWRGKDKTRILSPWEGLSANRRSCLKCGWCEGIRYETMGAIDVTLPNSVSRGVKHALRDRATQGTCLRLQGFIPLEACLKHLSAINIIDDAYCDRCTLRLTLTFYLGEAERLGKPKDENGKSSTARKKRAANARKIANRLNKMLEAGDIANMEQAEGLQDCKWLKAASRSARQSMIARVSRHIVVRLVRISIHLCLLFSHHKYLRCICRGRGLHPTESSTKRLPAWLSRFFWISPNSRPLVHSTQPQTVPSPIMPIRIGKRIIPDRRMRRHHGQSIDSMR